MMESESDDFTSMTMVVDAKAVCMINEVQYIHYQILLYSCFFVPPLF